MNGSDQHQMEKRRILLAPEEEAIILNVAIDHNKPSVLFAPPNEKRAELRIQWVALRPNITIATADAVAMPAPDVESQWRPEPTAPHFESQWRPELTAPHFESQSMQEHMQQVTASTVEFEDDRAGMGLGITLFILILLGFLALIIGSIILGLSRCE